jgi:hypothetical protein
MDTTTVLEIIKMIDGATESIHRGNRKDGSGNFIKDFPNGQAHSLEMLKDHLQSFIEGQLNALENRTEQ